MIGIVLVLDCFFGKIPQPDHLNSLDDLSEWQGSEGVSSVDSCLGFVASGQVGS